MDPPEEASRIFDRCLELCRRLAQPEPLTLAASGCVTVAQPDGPELGGGPRELGPESGRAAGSSLRLPCTGALANMMVHSDPALRIMAYARLLGGDEMGVARGACAVRDALAGLTTDRVRAAVRALAGYVSAFGHDRGAHRCIRASPGDGNSGSSTDARRDRPQPRARLERLRHRDPQWAARASTPDDQAGRGHRYPRRHHHDPENRWRWKPRALRHGRAAGRGQAEE